MSETDNNATHHEHGEQDEQDGQDEIVPAVRSVELQRLTHNEEPYVRFHDPLQLSDQGLMLPESLVPVLSFFDGKRTAAEIAQACTSEFGVDVPTHLIADMAYALDQCLLLDSPRAQTAIAATRAANGHNTTRPMSIAGAGYPDDVSKLRTLLDAYLPQAQNGAPATGDTPPTTPVGLLSPHIDYARGGNTYGEVWSAAAQAAQAADAVVIFATDHYGHDPFTLTRQHYATPYGALPNDDALHADLARVLGEEKAFAGELRHRREHSVELVAVWLHHMRQGNACPIVPILCGSGYEQILNGTSPSTLGHVDAVLSTIQKHMATRNILVVASGDLAHVGPAFRGKPLDDAARATLRAEDEELLAQMQQGDAEGFFQAISAAQDRNNVCGVMPIYLTMKLLERAQDAIRGQVTGYATCPADAQNTSVVTIAGVTFH